jgi:hypothetical protein
MHLMYGNLTETFKTEGFPVAVTRNQDMQEKQSSTYTNMNLHFIIAHLFFKLFHRKLHFLCTLYNSYIQHDPCGSANNDSGGITVHKK